MFPSFLCIGAQKAGTTWLYDNIRAHPGVWMAPVKEIFWFDRPTALPLALQLCQPRNQSLRQHTFGGLRKRLRRLGRRAAPSAGAGTSAAPAPAAAGTAGGPSRAQRALWHLWFMFAPRSDRWYGTLFRPRPGQIAGDINPYLAALERDMVERIHRLMPDIEIVYLLRNPIDRLWSQLGMSMKELGIARLESLDAAGLRRSLELGSQQRLSDYLGNLQRWREFYRPEQIFVGFFDQLEENPRALLRDIYGFLGLDASDALIPPSVQAKSNPGSGPAIPAEYAQLLARLFLPKLEALHQELGSPYTERWLLRAREMVASGASAPSELVNRSR
jgi:hypothetical protein